MNVARFSILTLVATLLLVNTVSAGKKKPDWVLKHPVSKLYYIGIASASKSESSADYMKLAQDDALANLASEIQVNISGELVHIMVEQAGMVQDDIVKEIRSSTQAELEGYELVDTWEDKTTYWVYYRLGRELYEQNERARLNKAISLALDFFDKGKKAEQKRDFEKALQFYFQAFNPIEKYFGEPLEAEYDGSRIYLSNELYSTIQSLLSRIELTPMESEVNGKIGQALPRPLQLKANCDGSPASNLPVSFVFTRGDGDIVSLTRADSRGIAKARVAKIKAMDKIQMVAASLDLNTLAGYDSASFLKQGLIKSFTSPTARFVINVKGLTACIESRENHLGKKLQVLAVEPALKEAMSRRGFTFVNNIALADLAITIEAQSREGVMITEGMYSSFIDMTLTAIDMRSGGEIYKKTLHKIKGIDLDYNKAGLKAFKNAGEKAADEALPQILEALQR